MYCICSTHLMHLSDGLNYLILRLPAPPFSGLVGEVYPPPMNFTWHLAWLDSTLGFLVLKGALSNTLDILFFWLLSRACSRKYLKGPDPFLRAPLYCFIFDVFGGSSKVV